MILSEQTFIELAGKQEVLDAKIKAAKGIAELPLERIELAYRVEAAECVNEMKGDMKYWSNKPMNRDAFLEEFVDALHFFLSWVNHAQFKIEAIGQNFDYSMIYSDFERSVWMVNDSGDEEREEAWMLAMKVLTYEDISYSFAALYLLVEIYDFTEQDVIDTYNKKNAVNHDRSDSGVY